MDPVILVSIAAFVGAAAFGGALFSMLKGQQTTRAEDRLDMFTSAKNSKNEVVQSLVKQDMINSKNGSQNDASTSAKPSGFAKFMEQADSPIDFNTFLMVTVGAAAVGAVGGFVGRAPLPLIPIFGIIASVLPVLWLAYRRKQRSAKFARQLPDALSLLARALRSGNSLNAGLNMIVEEMADPIGTEFQIAYEEQNLGIPIEQALKSMLVRMPNLDLKFFVTAVAIQRQTGGDLAEIIDKICEVIRERFKILGMVQALTGEGRLSGSVLMALPIGIFVAVYYLNPSYVMLLFTTPLGKKMVLFGIIMQIFGAVCIKKIVDIKV